MKTRLDIPEDELNDALRYTGAKTKREAIVFAVADFNRRQRLKQLANSLGTFDGFPSPDDSVNGRDDSVNGRDDSVNGRDDSVNGRRYSVNGRDDSVNGRDDSVNGRDDSVNGRR